MVAQEELMRITPILPEEQLLMEMLIIQVDAEDSKKAVVLLG